MAIDRTKLGDFLLEAMDKVEEEYGDEAELGELVLIFEVRRPDSLDEETRYSDISYYSSAEHRWEHIGLLTTALMAAEETD